MTTGTSLVLAVVAAALCAPSIAQTQANPEWDVAQLMQALRQVKAAKGRFIERKYLAIMNTPLESSGTLIYTAPARLEKHMLVPRQESMILNGDTLVIEDRENGRRRSFALQEHAVVWAFVESIRSTLAGDLQTLTRFYRVSLEGDAGRWRLLLIPHEPRMRDVATEIRISGRGAWVGAVEILDASGDRSVMTITRDAS